MLTMMLVNRAARKEERRALFVLPVHKDLCMWNQVEQMIFSPAKINRLTKGPCLEHNIGGVKML
jgi:hypothetical protein